MKNRLWRTLVRVTHISPDRVWLVIPGWDYNQQVSFPRSIFGDMELYIGKRFHAQVNLGAESAEEVVIEGIDAE